MAASRYMEKPTTYNRDETNVEAEKDEVCLPCNSVDHDGCELDNRVVEQPVSFCQLVATTRGLVDQNLPIRTSTPTIRLGPDPHGCDLSRVQPRNSKPADGKGCVIDEYEDCCDNGWFSIALGGLRKARPNDEQR